MADTLLCPECESPYADFNIEVTTTMTISSPVYVESPTTRWGTKSTVGHDLDFSETVDKIANKATWREAKRGELRLYVNVEESSDHNYYNEEVVRVACDNCGFVAEGEAYRFIVDLDYLPQ